MKILPEKSRLRKGKLLYRKFRHRGGHGIHSPFVYHLVTKVIGEKASYYRYAEIERVRKQLSQQDDQVSYVDRANGGSQCASTVSSLVRRKAMNAKQGKLLFRLTNYFQPRQILQVGSGMGISSLYMTSYAQGLNCIALEEEPTFQPVIEWVYEKGARNPIDLRVGTYDELLPQALEELGTIDFLFFNTADRKQEGNAVLFETCLPYVDDQTVFVCNDIQANQSMRRFWKEICVRPEVTVTIDLYSLGIVFFNKKLHKRDYTVYF